MTVAPPVRALGIALPTVWRLRLTLTSTAVATIAELSLPAPAVEPTRVALLDADRDFADAIPAEDQGLARSTLRLPRIALEPGSWAGPGGAAPPHGYLVLEGILSRTVTLHGRSSVELYGPGDLVSADELGAAEDVVWTVHQPSALAFLDDRFLLAGARWPRLWHVIVRRASLRADRLAAHLAALQLSRIDDRLESVLWQLADRWGKVTPDGVVLPLRLTHELLGRLTAAKRPTVSVALAALAESGAVIRRTDGSWLLRSAA